MRAVNWNYVCARAIDSYVPESMNLSTNTPKWVYLALAEVHIDQQGDCPT